MAKKPVKKESFIARQTNKVTKTIPAATDAANKIWVLIVTGTLWGAAYVVYMCSEAGVPQDVVRYLAGALFVLGLMYLFVNLRSVKPAGVVE